MAYVQSEVEAKIAALESALGRGEMRVDFADRSVTYRSVQDLTDALAYFKRILAEILATANPGTVRSRQSYAVGASGF